MLSAWFLSNRQKWTRSVSGRTPQVRIADVAVQVVCADTMAVVLSAMPRLMNFMVICSNLNFN